MENWMLYFIVINIITFLAYGLDKQKAKMRRWRIPEKVLLGLAAIGGSVGAYIGMRMFRHKTQKVKFSVGVPVVFLLQVAVGVYVCIIRR